MAKTKLQEILAKIPEGTRYIDSPHFPELQAELNAQTPLLRVPRELDLIHSQNAVVYDSFDSYGRWTEQMWFSGGDTPRDGRSLAIMSLGLAGETGEVIEHIKKLIRDDTFNEEAFMKELGDVIFYWARICRYFGLNPSDVIAANVKKLKSRRERGTMQGSGDNR